MGASVQELFDLQVKDMSDDEKRRLIELIALDLSAKNGQDLGPSEAALRQAFRDHFRRHAGAVSLGHPTGTGNDNIDADLAIEYGGDFEAH